MHVYRLLARAFRSSLCPARFPVRYSAVFMAAAAGDSGVATEHSEETQLAELVNPEAGLAIDIELKVTRNQLIDYSYKIDGAIVWTQKVQVVFQSKIPEQYCLGVAKLQRKDKNELKKVQDRWQTNTVWKFTSIKLLNDKPGFIHTSCRIQIDLRKSQAQALLQSTSFPEAPVPTVTLADILQLKQMQRFDLMAIPAKIIDERASSAGMRIVDVRLVDGSRQTQSNATEDAYASLPLTLFFKNESDLNSFKNNIGRTPLLFMALSGSRKQDKVQVITIKAESWWQPAAGSKCDAMTQEAARICDDGANLSDVATLREFQGTAIDYISPMATLTACRLMDPTSATPASLLGDATEHLYQLNHVYVVPPSKSDTIHSSDGRLFALLDVWDYSQKITLPFRSKAMLQLASLAEEQTQEYEDSIANDELRHPLLASLRVRAKTKTKPSEPEANATEPSQPQHDNVLSTIVVEAVPCTLTDIPNDAVDAIHGLLAGCPPTSERLAAVPVDKLKPSPFYNMLADGEPADKALTFLRFTQRVQDPAAEATTEFTNANQYATVALCTVEKCLDFSAARDTEAIAVISKVVAPSKPQQHAADLYIEAMQVIPKPEVTACLEMMRQLHRVSNTHSRDATASLETAWQQRKCRRLLRYPTQI